MSAAAEPLHGLHGMSPLMELDYARAAIRTAVYLLDRHPDKALAQMALVHLQEALEYLDLAIREARP